MTTIITWCSVCGRPFMEHPYPGCSWPGGGAVGRGSAGIYKHKRGGYAAALAAIIDAAHEEAITEARRRERESRSYARRPLAVGDRVRLEPGGAVRTVVRVSPGAAYLGGEPREVSVTEPELKVVSVVIDGTRRRRQVPNPKAGEVRMFVSYGEAVPISVNAFVYLE